MKVCDNCKDASKEVIPTLFSGLAHRVIEYIIFARDIEDICAECYKMYKDKVEDFLSDIVHK